MSALDLLRDLPSLLYTVSTVEKLLHTLLHALRALLGSESPSMSALDMLKDLAARNTPATWGDCLAAIDKAGQRGKRGTRLPVTVQLVQVVIRAPPAVRFWIVQFLAVPIGLYDTRSVFTIVLDTFHRMSECVRYSLVARKPLSVLF